MTIFLTNIQKEQREKKIEIPLNFLEIILRIETRNRSRDLGRFLKEEKGEYISRAGTSYRSNGPECEEFQRGCGCRTRKRRRPAARRERGRDPPCRSRRRNRSGVRNCSRWSPRPRSPAPRRGSRNRLRGIGASMPFSAPTLSPARKPQNLFLRVPSPPPPLAAPA